MPLTRQKSGQYAVRILIIGSAANQSHGTPWARLSFWGKSHKWPKTVQIENFWPVATRIGPFSRHLLFVLQHRIMMKKNAFEAGPIITKYWQLHLQTANEFQKWKGFVAQKIVSKRFTVGQHAGFQSWHVFSGFSYSEICLKSNKKSGQRAVKIFPKPLASGKILTARWPLCWRFWSKFLKFDNPKKPANSGTLGQQASRKLPDTYNSLARLRIVWSGSKTTFFVGVFEVGNVYSVNFPSVTAV